MISNYQSIVKPSATSLAVYYVAVSTLLFTTTLSAVDKPKAENKQTLAGQYLSAQEAYDLKKQMGDSLLFIDVRTPAEVVFVGKPVSIDINIPFMNLDYSRWNSTKKSFSKIKNKQFAAILKSVISSRKLNKKSPVVLLCRSGKRSAKAADLLTKNGFSNVFTIVEGFEGDKVKSGIRKGKRETNGWKNQGLPWSFKVSQNYFQLQQ